MAELEAAWVHPSAVVDAGARLGAGTRVWHFAHICAGARLGERCMVGQGCYVASSARLGRGVKLQNNVSVYDGVTLEDEVFCGPSAVFTNVLNPRAFVSRRDEYRPTLVRRGASIGANATLVCGVTLGEYCLIGAGAVVTRDVPAHALMVGVPARRLGWVSRRGHALRFDAGGQATCPESGERYRLVANLVSLVDE
ncbi:MAG: N-acetyltransferase [Polyangiaceae bacterium]|nr:N-acetyltransferase [Polyangiaceae bacterium]MCW5791045.1 N-acetyltransferase [Polyangiaceae bacterium]